MMITIGAMKNRPRRYGRYRNISPRKNSTATQVTAMTNSYMSPHGTRCTARPRMTTPAMCAMTPSTVSPSPAWTQKLASRRLGGGAAGRPVPPLAFALSTVTLARSAALACAGRRRLAVAPAVPAPAAPAVTSSGTAASAAGRAALAEREVGGERQYSQEVEHEGDHQEVVTEVGQPLVDGHQSVFPSLVSPTYATRNSSASRENSSSNPPAGSDRARPPTSTTVRPPGPG